ncbi:MAG: hypothetical protein AB7I27_02205 [Bacteriovoracaceae bacterium]
MSYGSTLFKGYRLQTFVIKCPYDTYRESEFTRTLMTDIFKLKFDGYRNHYPYGIMPISDYDFMANHICLTLENNGKYIPLFSYKSVTNEICKKFRVPFPVIGHKFGEYKENFTPWVNAILDWQRKLDQQNITYAYNASYTMNTQMDKDLRDLTRELTYAYLYYHYATENIKHVINSTASNHKINQHEEEMGWVYLKDKDGNKLPPFESPLFFEKPFYLMHTTENCFTENFRKKCEPYASLWERRIIIEEDSADIKKKVA